VRESAVIEKLAALYETDPYPAAADEGEKTATDGVIEYVPIAVGAVVLALYVVEPVPAYVYVTAVIVSDPCIPLNVNLGLNVDPTLTDERTAVTVGPVYRARELTVLLCVVVLAFVVVTVTVALEPLVRPVTVNGRVAPLAVPAKTFPAVVVGVKVVPVA
jgi:hypothetical protein